MGSSKKHKDKDRDHKKKKRRRSRSRSRSRDRKHRHEDREKRRHRDRAHKDVVFDDDEREREFQEFTEERVEIKREPDVPPPAESTEQISLSIEETNRLRAKLGLKPLEVDSAVKAEGDAEPKYGEEIHRPPVSITKQKQTEKIKERLSLQKQKRKISSKLQKVKTLGESDTEGEDALAWVRKSRKKELEKEMADKRAKLLEEMDEEFGVSALVDEEFKDTKKTKEYSSKDLKGITVEHGQDTFKEGQTVILTLKDKNILDEEEGDTLINVNMVDNEKYQSNIEKKKKKPLYNPYDDGNIDEFGMPIEKVLLSKYDEDLDGNKKEAKKFELGSGGKYDAEHEKFLKKYKAELLTQTEGLALPAPIIASEYYTQNEMESFKKVKKKVRKIRKKPKMLKADDLVPLQNTNEADLGSRNDKNSRSKSAAQPIDVTIPREKIDQSMASIPGLDFVEDMDVDQSNPLDDSEILGPEVDLTGVVVEDEAANDLETALAKARKLKQKKKRKGGEDVVMSRMQQLGTTVKVEPIVPMDNADGANIMLNSTSEFCRSLGEIPTYGQAGNRNEEEEDELLDFENELLEERRQSATEEEVPGTGWQSVEIDTRPVDIKDEEMAALDDEPVVDAGLASALKLASKKGYIEADTKKKGATAPTRNKLNIESEFYSIEDKRYDDLDEKYNRKRDRFSIGATMEFKELDYKPDVKLEYVDETGRSLNPKEAFRQLSHRFHGKGSGKKKIEKRTKKLEQDQLLKNASSTDTPLGTVGLLREKQKAEKSAYVVLSGGNKLTANTISKM